VNQDQLISAVRKVFAKKKSKYCRVDETRQLLLEEGLNPDEAEQAISLAEDNQVIRVCYPRADGIHGDESYELLTDRDREIDKWLEEEAWKEK
jgi:hypothetical protein